MVVRDNRIGRDMSMRYCCEPLFAKGLDRAGAGVVLKSGTFFSLETTFRCRTATVVRHRDKHTGRSPDETFSASYPA